VANNGNNIRLLQIATGINDNGGKFAAGVVDTGGK
jgi:hypothetical protein